MASKKQRSRMYTIEFLYEDKVVKISFFGRVDSITIERQLTRKLGFENYRIETEDGREVCLTDELVGNGTFVIKKDENASPEDKLGLTDHGRKLTLMLENQLIERFRIPIKNVKTTKKVEEEETTKKASKRVFLRRATTPEEVFEEQCNIFAMVEGMISTNLVKKDKTYKNVLVVFTSDLIAWILGERIFGANTMEEATIVAGILGEVKVLMTTDGEVFDVSHTFHYFTDVTKSEKIWGIPFETFDDIHKVIKSESYYVKRLAIWKRHRRRKDLLIYAANECAMAGIPLTKRDVLKQVLDSRWFTIIITTVVLFAMMLTVLPLYGVLEDSAWLVSCELFIAVFFLLEVIFRLFAYGIEAYFLSGLCIIDLLVTALDWASLLATSVKLDAAIFLRIVRISRLSRVSRITRDINTGGVGYNKDPIFNDIDKPKPLYDVTKDQDGRIYKYDPGALFTSGYIFNLSGSMVEVWEVWVQLIFLIILTTLWGAVMCPIECDHNSHAFDPIVAATNECDGCITGFSTDLGLIFGTLVAFLLSVFVSITYDRWWQTRRLVNSLLDELNDAAMYIVSFSKPAETIVDGDDGVVEDSTVSFQRQYIRFLNLTINLFVKEIQQDGNYADLVSQRYLSERQWDSLENKPRPYNQVLLWLSQMVTNAARNNALLFPPRTLLPLLDKLIDIRSEMARIQMYLRTQLPYAYTHMVTLIVKLHLVFITLIAGTLVGQGVIAGTVSDVIYGYLLVILNNLVFEGLLRIHVVLTNPFGGRACDFPITMWLDQVATETSSYYAWRMSAPEEEKWLGGAKSIYDHGDEMEREALFGDSTEELVKKKSH